MGAWKAVTRALYELGPGEFTSAQIGDQAGFDTYATMRALQGARALGLCALEGRHGSGAHYWFISALGRDLIEGRVTQVGRYPGGRRWVATWLRSLPRDISFAQPPKIE